MDKSRFQLSLQQKRNYSGYLWIAPFLIGFTLFFLNPVIQSLQFSISELEITADGFELHFVGLENFHYALLVNPEFVEVFTETVLDVVINIPAVIIFSFFVANLLNQKFKGRFLVRLILFLPVILTAGIVYELEQEDFMHELMALGAEAEEAGFLNVAVIEEFLLEIRLPAVLIEYIILALDRVPDIIDAAAIPILIFLAGLQSIPASLYECARMEGATGWESFWKITFPLISPLFLTNIIFIIINSFTAPGNELVALIENVAWSGNMYGVSVAMTWFYFVAITIILGAVYWIISRKIVFME